MTGCNRRLWIRGLKVLGIIWLLGAIADRLWFALDRAIPHWDQADYLTGALNYWQALQTAQWFNAEWWTELWQLSSKIPPLVYISAAPFLSLFGPGFDQTTLVNLVYSAVLLASVYTLGVSLFSVSVGLWAAGLCVLMPGLYRVRLDFLLDHPLAAAVTLCFACLTLWRQRAFEHSSYRYPVTGSGHRVIADQVVADQAEATVSSPESGYWLSSIGKWKKLISSPRFHLPRPTLLNWLLAAAFGLTFGVALMVKQPAIMFLLVPIVWVGVETLWQRNWGRLAQLTLAFGLSLLVFGPWYRTNWLLMLSASKRATIDSAIAEGDPPLTSLDAWTYYLKLLPSLVSLPLLLVGLMGLLFFWRRSRVSSQWADAMDYAPKSKDYRQQTYAASRRSLNWLLVFVVGGYLLSSLNMNKDTRYLVPALPVVGVILSYGLTLLPKHWKPLQWGTVGLATVLMGYHLFPLQLNAGLQNRLAYYPAYSGETYPHQEVIAEVIQTEPYLRSTIGVLPSTPEVNQHNVNYYGNLRNFQVYGRQVGTRVQHVQRDGRSLSWFITKTGDQGSIRKPEAQAAIVQFVEQSGGFTLHKTWKLPDSSTLRLFRRRVPPVEVTPAGDNAALPGMRGLSSATPKIALEQVIVPAQVPAGIPVPVTYRWSGEWETLRTGLVLLTWRRQANAPGNAPNAPTRWLHDHAIGMGSLHPAPPSTVSLDSTHRNPHQVIERLAMLPPANAAPGIYTLEATYLNRLTGETAAIALPAINLRVNPTAPSVPAPELDLNTQLRSLAGALPEGVEALDKIFDEIGRINQYDPVQDYVDQTRQAMEYRLTQEPENLEFAYTLALAHVLKQRVEPAIATLQQVVQLDAQNPIAYAYLAFVNLYDFRPKAAQEALTTALQLNPNLPELYALNGVAALMRGHLVQAWQSVQKYQEMMQDAG